MTYEEYRRELNEALEKADACMGCHFHPPVIMAQWQKLHDEYYERTKR